MRLARSTAFMRHPQALHACTKALHVIAQHIHVVVEGIQLGARHHIARLLGDELSGAVGQIDRSLARVLQGAAQGVGDLHAQYFAEYTDERLLPVRIEALGQLLQAARQLGIAGHAHTALAVVVAMPCVGQQRQLCQHAGQAATHGQVGFLCVHRADPQLVAVDADAHRQRRRFQSQVDMPAIEAGQCMAGIRIQRQRAVQGDLQGAASDRLEGLEQERAMHAFYLRGWGLGPGCRAAGLPGCRAAARHPW